MGRCRRLCFPGAFYHCINRGNRREQIYGDPSDYQQMLEGLEKISSRYKVRIHSYCLMPNHFHLLIEQQDLSVSLAMRSLATRECDFETFCALTSKRISRTIGLQNPLPVGAGAYTCPSA